jgi:hypothetical protein
MPASATALAPATRTARGGEIFHLADHRRLDTLAGAEQVDRPLREVAGALGRRGVADLDHERAAADRGAVGPFGGEARLCATVTAVRQSYQEPKSHSD